jgi:hypothetical protein
MMTLDDGSTHRKSDPHAASLGCVERLEELVRRLRFEAHPGIVHAEAHAIALVWLGSDY